MSAITPDRYKDFGKTSYINYSYIPETFCVGSVGQYSSVENIGSKALIVSSIERGR